MNMEPRFQTLSILEKIDEHGSQLTPVNLREEDLDKDSGFRSSPLLDKDYRSSPLLDKDQTLSKGLLNCHEERSRKVDEKTRKTSSAESRRRYSGMLKVDYGTSRSKSPVTVQVGAPFIVLSSFLYNLPIHYTKYLV